MSLQVRLTLLFLILGAPLLVIFGVAVYLVSKERLYAGVDASLRGRAATVSAAIQRRDGKLTISDIETSRHDLNLLAFDGSPFEVLDANFRLLYSTDGMFSDFGREGGQPNRAEYVTTNFADVRVRTLTWPVHSIGEFIGYVQTSTSVDLVDASLRRIGQVLAFGGVLVLAATALPAYLLVGRAIDPVRRVSRMAGELERTADFSQRLAVEETSKEMQELTDAFNRMVERVEKLMQAQRSFLADSSHELRRPLTLLRTNIDVINDPGLTEADRRLVESEMRAEAEAMSQLVSNLVLLSREGDLAFAFEPVNLTTLCQRAVDQVSQGFSGHRFRCDLDEAVWACLDAERFSQVLANLLQNAATYSAKGGSVHLSLNASDEGISLAVADQGCGMNEADVKHAFDRFYRGSSSRELRTEGFGLGLAIVRHVVQAHSGRVELTSKLGAGTTVRISLPAEPAKPLRGSPITPARGVASEAQWSS